MKVFVGNYDGRIAMMQGLLNTLFDKIYVLSLARSVERRNHIREHLSALGITDYVFFDAVAEDDLQVREAFENDQVAMYPPCFRCGQLECKRSDCNNQLMPAQIANFMSCRFLWAEIAKQEIRALVIEDDVVFAPNALSTLQSLRASIEQGSIPFNASSPTLLRMGWALGPDHKDGDFRIEPAVRMSNPCYALTSAFARKLVDGFSKYSHTSDMFVQTDEFVKGDRHTIFPPVAYEMSWSTGEVESLIHPKSIRVNYLKEKGEAEAAQAHERRIRLHAKHKYYRPILILEPPNLRPKGLIAEALADGFKIGNGIDAPDGLISWRFAGGLESPDADPPALRSVQHIKSRYVVYAARDPWAAIWEIHKLLLRANRSELLRSFGLKAEPTLETASNIYLKWADMIEEAKPDFCFRVEDQLNVFREFLESCKDIQRLPRQLEVSDRENIVRMADISNEVPKINNISEEIFEKINSNRKKLGY